MSLTRFQKLKLSLIKSWPLSNKMRLANSFIPKTGKNGSSIFKGLSFMNEESVLQTDTSSYLENNVFVAGSYEAHIVNLIKSQVNEGGIALDIGANIGIHAVTMARKVGNKGAVYAFEPIGFLREKLEHNIWLNNLSNVNVVPFALSDVEGEDEVFFDTNASNQGTFSLASKTKNNNQKIQIKKGDQLIEELKISRIDFIKIDVEGFEYKVLQGIKSTIEAHLPRIIFEHDDNYTSRAADNGQDIATLIYNFFNQLDYQLFTIEEYGLIAIENENSMPTWGNIFALPPNKSKKS